MIKKAKKLILLAFLLSTTYVSYAQDNVIDQIIWVVGDEAILKSEFEEARKEMVASGQRMEGDPYCFIPEQLAVQKLYLDQAKIDSITISEGDLARSVTHAEKFYINNLGSKEKVEEYFNMSIADFRDKLRDQERTKYLVGEVRKKLVGKVNLTPSEVRKYYSQLPVDSLPYIPTTVEVQIITNEPTVPLKVIDDLKGKLREFTKRINAGESFSTLAILYSEDGSASNGGELGFMGRAQLVPEFANVAFSLSDPTKVSNVVESEYGFHIIQLIERRGDRINVRHILLRPKVPTKEMNEAVAKMDSMAMYLRNDTFTFGKAVDLFSDKDKNDGVTLATEYRDKKFTFEDAVTSFSADKDTRKNNGVMVNNKETYSGYVTTSRFTMEELPQEVGKVVKNMKVGDVSSPFTMKTPSGKEVVAIVKLKNKIEGHVANVSDDYETLKGVVENKKQQDILTKWLQTKIKDTYVYIDNSWKNCDFQYSGWVKDNEQPKLK